MLTNSCCSMNLWLQASSQLSTIKQHIFRLFTLLWPLSLLRCRWQVQGGGSGGGQKTKSCTTRSSVLRVSGEWVRGQQTFVHSPSTPSRGLAVVSNYFPIIFTVSEFARLRFAFSLLAVVLRWTIFHLDTSWQFVSTFEYSCNYFSCSLFCHVVSLLSPRNVVLCIMKQLTREIEKKFNRL